MPLEPYLRGSTWWVKGRVEYNGLQITSYYRQSTGASSRTGAEDWVAAETERQIRCHLLGEDASLTFNDAVLLYPAKPADAKFLTKIIPILGERLCNSISGSEVRDLGPELYPNCSTDTWRRQVISPVSAVINYAHDKRLCAPIRIKGYTPQERIDQDAKRGKLSRQKRPAGSWEWIDSVTPHCNVYVAAGLEMMFETGIRIGQLIAIEPDDLKLEERKVRIIAQKGHEEQWITISHGMMITLANLPKRHPVNRVTGRKGPAKVFGYGNRTGFTTALRTACKRAGVEYMSPHEAGRRGFYTELRVRQGADPVTSAKAGRWKNHKVPDAIYAAVESEEQSIRERIRTNRVQVVRTKKASR